MRVRLGLVAALLVVGGCANPPPNTGSLWHGGQLTIGTGPTTGVFYQVGGGYADIISAYLDGYDASAAATAGAADNILRLAAGDIDVAFTFADVGADAVHGRGVFTSPQRIEALAAIYRSYTHLIVRTDSGVTKVADLEGKRVSTGPVNSGTETMALRILTAVGIDPNRDVQRRSLSLAATTRGIVDGSLDAMFYTAGLPTTGVTELLNAARNSIRFLPLTAALPGLEKSYPGTYVPATIPRAVYEIAADVPTVAVSNMIVVSDDMPDDLAYALTRLIFAHQRELAQTHPEWGNVQRDVAHQTGAVTLHPGANRYYRGG
ncbi:MAG TPA: TAXI family TRAP transporter solute-binding subunit [Micromonosporaceae bacterium]|nr:TAXI family TRAP transporter solute-binding subunit [Micromonosporaceae bacterium]